MRVPVRVVINCAGEGRRLGLGKTKALVSVLDRPLIEWQLRMLRDVEDVVVVVGHQCHEVVDVVCGLRRDVAFAFNHEHATTGTAASFALGCRGARGDVVSLDGDLLVHPADFAAFVDEDAACLGVMPPTSSDAVFAAVEQREGMPSATAFNRSGTAHEWTGLLRVPAEVVRRAQDEHATRGHVYEMLTPHLPLPVREVRAREIDTPADYDRALSWVATVAEEWP